ncbi:SWIM zinc finger family protein [Streptomyces sp. NPDC052114]|uniref:SWIM zinc finger family protein n=1 Tax=unclassified Streptomyces TaxID=2593676 RepID=UPI003425A4D3
MRAGSGTGGARRGLGWASGMSETSRMGSGRVFPALPAHRDPKAPFATSWWGNAWIAALEDSALDQGRLTRGRGYAREGAVDTITVAPGRIVAYVHGSRPRPYRAEIRLRTMLPEHWDRFLDAVAAEPAHIAALLDKDMPHALADAATRADVPLLPGGRELAPSCTCPDRGHPCKHAAALAYQTARLLDADPFVLLLLRGGEEQDLLDELSHRNARKAVEEERGAEARRRAPSASPGPSSEPPAAEPLEPSKAPAPPQGTGPAEPSADGPPEPPAPPLASLPGVLAREALATDHRSPLPPPLPPPAHPGDAPVLPSLPGAPDPTALEFLVTDAAARAHAFLTTGADPFTAASAWHDAVRLAASHPGLTGRRTFSRQFAELARSVGSTPADLSRASAAWRQGGEEGLAVLESPWDPPAGPFDRARGALTAADLPRMTIHRNHLTNADGTLQLRFGHDARWYPYLSEPGADDWWPEGEADGDPVGALAGVIGDE